MPRRLGITKSSFLRLKRCCASSTGPYWGYRSRRAGLFDYGSKVCRASYDIESIVISTSYGNDRMDISAQRHWDICQIIPSSCECIPMVAKPPKNSSFTALLSSRRSVRRPAQLRPGGSLAPPAHMPYHCSAALLRPGVRGKLQTVAVPFTAKSDAHQAPCYWRQLGS
jgi:hypothetical protein